MNAPGPAFDEDQAPAAVDSARVLARIRVAEWGRRPRAQREEVCAWLRANGVDPNRVTLHRDVEVVLLDAPAIVREEYLLTEDGHKFIVPGTLDAAVRVVHSLLRVPLPEHLSDPA